MTVVPEPVLQVEGLRTYIDTDRGTVRCVDGADLVLHRGETLGLVGESGCGKSMTARSVMGLVQEAPGVVAGRILFHPEGCGPVDLTASLRHLGTPPGTKDMRRWHRDVHEIYQGLWGRHLSIVFQDPQTSLNPYWTVGEQLSEAVKIGGGELALTANDRRRECLSWLERVHIPSRVYDTYPHELSGGQCQRVMIAVALASQPDLLIADEPTTGLDVTIQARIVELFKELRRDLKLTVLLISHDIGLIGQLSDRVAVMYCGRVVECGSRDEILSEDGRRHPYTEALLRSLPGSKTLHDDDRLPVIGDAVPDPLCPPPGCAFHPRCSVWKASGVAIGPCDVERPPQTDLSSGHWASCWQLTSEGMKK